MGRLSRLVTVVVGLGLLAMPVSFRGGADEAHPHSIFQIIGANGEAALHHHLDDAGGVGPDGAHRDPATGQSLSAGADDTPAVEAASSAAERAGAAAVWTTVGEWLGASDRAGRASSLAELLPNGRNDAPLLPPPRAAATVP